MDLPSCILVKEAFCFYIIYFNYIFYSSFHSVDKTNITQVINNAFSKNDDTILLKMKYSIASSKIFDTIYIQ